MNNVLVYEDSLTALKRIPDKSVSLIMTSPPYANQRESTYGGIHPDKYVDWFCSLSPDLYRVLKDDGSFVLNIKENVVNGQRHTYVIELILALKKHGWLWIDEFIWHKKDPMPGKWPNRLKDGFERCLHFTKNRKFVINHYNVAQEPKPSTKKRFALAISKNESDRQISSNKSGFGATVLRSHGIIKALPSNVLHISSETKNRGHSAVFPEKLPEFFIKLLSNKDDIVFDPFCGSGTTCLVAHELGRKFIGIDNNFESINIAIERLKSNNVIFDIIHL